MEMLCPSCGSKMEVLIKRIEKFRRRYSEFDMNVLILRCPNCKKIGIFRQVPELNMENFEYPYEGLV
ncbi:MAG: hypothetical protein QXK03_04160 [Archaeoglobaceae archaeon]